MIAQLIHFISNHKVIEKFLLLIAFLFLKTAIAKSPVESIVFLNPLSNTVPVIQEAQNQGYETILVMDEPYLNAIGGILMNGEMGKCANYLVDTLNWENSVAIREVITRFRTTIAGIYPGSEPTIMAGARLREHFGIRPTIKPQNYAFVLDKQNVRNALRKAGLSRLNYFSSNDLKSKKSWPWPGKAGYFKPRHGLASGYVKRVESLEEVRKQAEFFQSLQGDEAQYFKNYFHSSNADYFIEEESPGTLFSVEGMSHAGKYYPLGLLSRIMKEPEGVIEMGSVFPYPHEAWPLIVEKVRAAHIVLGFTTGPSHVEVMVHKNASGEWEVEIVDFNPRFAGADVIESINNAYNFSFEKNLLSFAKGEFQPYCIPDEHGYCCLQYFFAPNTIEKIDSIEFPQDDEVVFRKQILPDGSLVRGGEQQFDYAGCYLTGGSDPKKVEEHSKILRPKVLFNGSEGAVF